MHYENPYTNKWIVIRTESGLTKTHTQRIWIVIRTEMCMTKTHTTRIWIFIRTEMCMMKTQTLIIDSNSYKDVHDENP